MDRYQVDVVTDHGAISGLAVDIQADSEGEFMIIESVEGIQMPVRVDYIKKISVLSEPRRFDEWIFRGPLK